MLTLENVHAYYGKSHVLHGISLEVGEGEVVGILGRNGVGKTTTMKSIIGLVDRKGLIRFNGKDISGLPPYKIARLGIGYVPQGRMIFPGLTVFENLIVGAKQEDTGKLNEIYELFPRLDERRDQLAGTLSGGEQQMLAIARALMSSPDLMLLDEPSTGLSPIATMTIYEKLKELTSRLSLLIAEQNVHQAFEIADRIYVLENGRIVAEGKPSELSEDGLIKSAYFGVRE